MLKKILVIITISLFLVGCRPVNVDTNTESRVFSILSYNGTPSLTLLAITNDNYDIKITNTNDSIKFSMEKADKDFVIAPIDSGVKYAQEYGKYKLLSVIEYGTLSLASTDPETTFGKVGAYGKDSIVGNLTSFFK